MFIVRDRNIHNRNKSELELGTYREGDTEWKSISCNDMGRLVYVLPCNCSLKDLCMKNKNIESLIIIYNAKKTLDDISN